MRKALLSAGMLVGITATAQTDKDYDYRVGLNTQTPRASLEVAAINNGKAQGVLLPHISEEEKAKWETDDTKGLVAGTIIWNTTKLCLDYFDGTNWQCTDGSKTNVHPNPWTPAVASFTGKAIWGDDTGETLSVRKNNCTSGQGVPFNYPVNNSQHITYTATSTISQADADQKALELMNSTAEQTKRQTLAQNYANQNGTCTTTGIDSALPSGITIANGSHWISSILDSDYLPFTAPTQPADWKRQHNPGGADTSINVQGTIPSTGITVYIPVSLSRSGSYQLPAYSYEISTIADAWKDNTAKTLVLSWEAQTLTSTKKSITATIKVKNATTNQNLTQLDLREGLGNDYKGILLGQFKMPKNSTETTDPTKWTGTYDVRVISGIPDRKFGETDQKHDFLYLPVLAENGKIWLNNNLGANYSNVRDRANFNPGLQAQGEDDWKSYGSLFQWQRPADGHELVSRTNGATGTLSSTTTSRVNSTQWIANHSLFVRNTQGYWVSDSAFHPSTYRSTWKINENNNPCPIGYHVPDDSELRELGRTAFGNPTTFGISILRLPKAGIRDFNTATYSGSGTTGSYWGSDRWAGIINVLPTDYVLAVTFSSTSLSPNNNSQYGTGRSVRCIKD